MLFRQWRVGDIYERETSLISEDAIVLNLKMLCCQHSNERTEEKHEEPQ